MGGQSSKIELTRVPMAERPIYTPPHGAENGSLLNATTTLNGHATTPSISTPTTYSTDNPVYHSYNTGSSKPNKQKKSKLRRIPQSFPPKERELLHNETGGKSAEADRLRGKLQEVKNLGTAPSENRFWWLLVAVFSVFDVLLIVLIILTSLESTHSHRKMRSDVTTAVNAVSPMTSPLDSAEGSALPEDAPFCLPCSDVYLTSLEVTQNRHGVTQKMDPRSKTLLCCADNHDSLDLLLDEMYTRVQYTKDRATGKVKVLKEQENKGEKWVDHHLQLFYDTIKQPQEVNGKFSIPLTTQGRRLSSTSVMFQDGVVRVNSTGHFYIYSQVPFEFSSLHSSSSASKPSTTSFSTTSRYLPLTQQVVKIRNDGKESVLLENSVFPCDVNAKQSGQHSFVAGIFHLVERDVIALRVSDHRRVNKWDEVQFGIHRL